MKKTKVYSVKFRYFTQISAKCWKATDWDGNTILIPDSQYFGQDYSVSKSNSYWIACWIIDKSDINVSTKKTGWYNPKKNKVEAPIEITVEHHVPDRAEPVDNNYIEQLKR